MGDGVAVKRRPMKSASVPALSRMKSLSDVLCPSTGPTPRLLHPLSNSAVIMAPSGGVANDPARLRNQGCALRATSRPRGGMEIAPLDMTQDLLKVSSMPSLFAGAKTPRTQRGLVRKVSKVSLDYPGGTCLRLWPPERRPARLVLQGTSGLSMGPPVARPASPSPAKTRKVTFADEVWEAESRTGKVFSSKSRDDGAPTPQLKRSIVKMDALWDLRRCGRDGKDGRGRANSPSSPGSTTQSDRSDLEVEARDGNAAIESDLGDESTVKPASPEGKSSRDAAGNDEEEALMYGILRDLHDTEAPLRDLAKNMDGILKQASGAGGSRHPTAVISNRVHAVAARKADLLHDVEARTAEFAAAHDRREQLLPQLVAGTAEAPEALGGVKKFLAAYTHAAGHPADENKSVFAKFVSTFKLPKNHGCLIRFRTIAEDAAEWWAATCLKQAEEGHGHAVLRRSFDVALGTGVDPEHPLLLRATKILNDRLAERVLQEAQERQSNDARQEESGRMPRVGAASSLADKIEQEVWAAVAEGVPNNEPRLQQSTEICKQLRQKDGERKRLEGRQKRLEANAKAKAQP